MEILTVSNDKPVLDALFYIPALFCPGCDEWRDFYLDDSVPYCDCCHDQLTATQEDIEKVADRSPRASILRLRNKTA